VGTQTILDGAYRLIRPAGTGATARVFLAEEVATGRQVAVKVLHRELLADREMKARFQREAALLWQIDHPNVVKLYRFEDQQKEGLLLILEWVDGIRLDQLIEKHPLPGPVAIALLTELASALGAIHQNGIAHRDVKPENVMVQGWPDAPTIKLLDFGIARFTDPEEAALMFQTGVNQVGGTPAYVSPEQAMGKPATASSDVYSLGVVGYRLLSGALPFQGNHFVILSAHLNEKPPPLVPLDPSIAKDHALEVVMQCLLKNPAKRPADGAAVEAALKSPKKSRWSFKRS
jgi:serine/threonine protein kinase, bacterial